MFHFAYRIWGKQKYANPDSAFKYVKRETELSTPLNKVNKSEEMKHPNEQNISALPTVTTLPDEECD